MNGKLSAACLAVVALAACWIVPSLASAGPALTHPTGTRLPTLTKITGTNVGNMLLTDGAGKAIAECSSAVLTGELLKNNGAAIEAELTSAVFAGTRIDKTCTASFFNNGITVTSVTANGLPWCFIANGEMGIDEAHIRGGSCIEEAREIRVELDLGMMTKCVYKREAVIAGSMRTDVAPDNSDAIVQLSNVLFTYVSGMKPPCPMQISLDLNFTLETDEAMAEPLYFSIQ
jgi:hypothetical protein